ncbi:MAG: phosphatidylserine decarboxylase family protein, partial [Crocinitomicaceae bacterium]|nr:phosphatidylserine decarboxylase family protein [Crocinitomicaceae bacterium]
HKEGIKIILGGLVFTALSILLNVVFVFDDYPAMASIIIGLTLLILILITQFFRIPKRSKTYTEKEIVCPADGKVVVIEETEETEYFNDRRIQVSIFMSPLNVHANYYPITGSLVYQKYHPGKFLVAWHPKSSTENERTTMVVKDDSGREILIRQIAGAVARRICYYGEPDTSVLKGEELGFIKFGSRVDLFLPLGTKIDVNIGDKVQSRLSNIGFLN